MDDGVIRMTYSTAFDLVNNWPDFCDAMGVEPYILREGGGHVVAEITVARAREFGILRDIHSL